MCDDASDSDFTPALFWGLGLAVPATIIVGSIYGPSEFVTAIEVGGVTFLVTVVSYSIATKGIGGSIAEGAVGVVKGLICGIINEI